MITRDDILQALESETDGDQDVLEAGSDQLVVNYPDEVLSVALAKMLQNDVGRLPVVQRENPQQLLGYLSRGGILQARQQRLREEHVLERGWLIGGSPPER